MHYIQSGPCDSFQKIFQSPHILVHFENMQDSQVASLAMVLPKLPCFLVWESTFQGVFFPRSTSYNKRKADPKLNNYYNQTLVNDRSLGRNNTHTLGQILINLITSANFILEWMAVQFQSAKQYILQMTTEGALTNMHHCKEVLISLLLNLSFEEEKYQIINGPSNQSES